MCVCVCVWVRAYACARISSAWHYKYKCICIYAHIFCINRQELAPDLRQLRVLSCCFRFRNGFLLVFFAAAAAVQIILKGFCF